MPNPKFVGTVFVNDVTNSIGWSYNWYPLGLDAATCVGQMQNLITALKATLPTAYQIVFARVDNTDHPRDSEIVPETYPVAGTYVGLVGTALMAPDSCWFLTMFGTATQKNRHFMRGLWGQDTLEGNRFVPTVPMQGFIAALSAVLTSDFAVARVKKLDAGYTVPCVQTIESAIVKNRKTGRPFGLPVGRRR